MNLVMEQLQSMWRMMARWLCFFSSRPTSVILTHYIIAPDLTTAPTLSVSAVARSWPVRGAKKKKKEMPLTCSRPPDEGIMASSYRSRAPCLSSCGRKSCHLMWRGPFGWDRLIITLHCRSSLLLSPVLLAHSTEMQVGDLSRLNPQKSDRPLAL